MKTAYQHTADTSTGAGIYVMESLQCHHYGLKVTFQTLELLLLRHLLVLVTMRLKPPASKRLGNGTLDPASWPKS